MTDMVSAKDVLDAIEKAMRIAIPTAKRMHLERINLKELPAISIEVIAFSPIVQDMHRTRKSLDLDFIFLSSKNKIAEGLGVMERISQVFGLGLHVKDRYIHTTGEGPEMKFVDQDLHVLIEYVWFDDFVPLIVTGGGHLGEMDPDKTDPGNIQDEHESPKDPDEKNELKQEIQYMELLFTDIDV